MKKGKLFTLSVVLLGIIGIGMVGPVAANPCPDPGTWNGKPESNLVTVIQTDLGGNLIKYSTGGPTSSDQIKEVCIATPAADAQSGTVFWDSWSLDLKNTAYSKTWAQFSGPSNPNIPFDGVLHDVGNVQWSSAPDNSKYLVHIISTDICGDEETCFVRPTGPNPPVPELSTIVLTSTGLLGLVLASRRYKKM